MDYSTTEYREKVFDLFFNSDSNPELSSFEEEAIAPSPDKNAEVFSRMGGFIADCTPPKDIPINATFFSEPEIDPKLYDMKGFIAKIHIRNIKKNIPDWVADIVVKNNLFDPMSPAHMRILDDFNARLNNPIFMGIIRKYCRDKVHLTMFDEWYINSTIYLEVYSKSHVEIGIALDDLKKNIDSEFYQSMNITEQLIYYFINYCNSDAERLSEHIYFQCPPEFLVIINEFTNLMKGRDTPT